MKPKNDVLMVTLDVVAVAVVKGLIEGALEVVERVLSWPLLVGREECSGGERETRRALGGWMVGGLRGGGYKVWV